MMGTKPFIMEGFQSSDPKGKIQMFLGCSLMKILLLCLKL